MQNAESESNKTSTYMLDILAYQNYHMTKY